MSFCPRTPNPSQRLANSPRKQKTPEARQPVLDKTVILELDTPLSPSGSKGQTMPQAPLGEQNTPPGPSGSRTQTTPQVLLEQTDTPASPSRPKSQTMPQVGMVAEIVKRHSLEAQKTAKSPLARPVRSADKVAEGRKCLARIKKGLSETRNTKKVIVEAIAQAAERMYEILKEVDMANRRTQREPTTVTKESDLRKEPVVEPEVERRRECGGVSKEEELLKRLEEHSKKLEENSVRMDKLQQALEQHREVQPERSYASVAAEPHRNVPWVRPALHSIVVTGQDEKETGEQVLERIRKVVNAKEGGMNVEKVRKAKDGRIIMGCKTERDRNLIKERLKRDGRELKVEDVKNKDPLVVLMDVMKYNTDDDIVAAIRNQNRDLIQTDGKLEIAYKRRARNPLTHHVVMRVSTQTWGRMTEAGHLHIDLQKVRVMDQSPLVQCSLCLGYGHGRRFCTETVEKCSHCGGPHKKDRCEDFLTAIPPSCCNCSKAAVDEKEHNAFDKMCPVRRKWEALARASIAYC